MKKVADEGVDIHSPDNKEYAEEMSREEDETEIDFDDEVAKLSAIEEEEQKISALNLAKNETIEVESVEDVLKDHVKNNPKIEEAEGSPGLSSHMSISHKCHYCSDGLRCELCLKFQSSKAALKQHMRRIHTKGPLYQYSATCMSRF